MDTATASAGRRSHSPYLPPGFRFHPTDEELIMHYLTNHAASRPCPVPIIFEIDIYKFDPWELPEKAEFGENEWYFFTPLDRKYPNGNRPNRAAVSGYWKATGTDKPIYSQSKYVGVKKSLVFYKGKPPKGLKTNWIMHEYRLNESRSQQFNCRQNGSMRLDDWVLCRIYKKKLGKVVEEKMEHLQQRNLMNPVMNSFGFLPQIVSEDSYNSKNENPSTSTFATSIVPQQPYEDAMEFQMNQNISHPFHINNPMLHFQ